MGETGDLKPNDSAKGNIFSILNNFGVVDQYYFRLLTVTITVMNNVYLYRK